MIGPGIAGSSFDAYVSGFEAGLVGTLTFSIETDLGVVVLAPTTAGIIEIDAGGVFSVYKITQTYPAPEGDYVVIWENPNTGVQGAEELVTGSVITPVTPEPVVGPCGGAWLELDEIAACCDDISGTDVSDFTNENEIATNVLWRLSGRQYGGVCERTVRPCSSENLCGIQVLSRGHIVDTGGPRVGVFQWNNRDWGVQCGCRPLSRVLLPGYPVREILEVLVDGAIVSPSTYQIQRRRWLVRMRDPADPDTALSWPSCQNLDLEDDQEGTWSVRYLSGVDPPPEGVAAAAALACEIHKACADGADLDGCQLPRGVTRVERQGVVFDIQAFTNWGFNGKWQSGLPLVDMFLNSVNPNGLRRRPAVWGPDGPHYAQPAGV